MPALDSNGRPVSGAELNFYVNETTTRKAVYTTIDLTTAHSNPVVADAAGGFPSIFAEIGSDESPNLYSATCFSPAGVQLPKGGFADVRALVYDFDRADIEFSNVDPTTGRTALEVYSVDDVNVRVDTIYDDIDSAIADKADLVSGKVPAAQLPPAAADALKATENFADLDDPAEASKNVNIDPELTGSQAASVWKVGTEWVTPNNFAVDFNGANSAAGLQALFDAAAGRSLRLPPGLFSTDTAINLTKGKPYDIRGAQGNVYGANVGGAVLRNTNTSGGHLLVYDDTALAYSDEFHSVISGLTLTGNALSGDNLRLIGAHHLTLRKIWSTTAGGSAVNFVQDCWSNTIDDVTCVQSGEWGLRLGRRTNSFTVIAGQYIANARKTHGGSTWGGIGIFGSSGMESRHINFVGLPDISYNGENPFGGATVTRAYNFYSEYTYGLHGSLYSEDGLGDASGNSIVLTSTNKLVNLAMVYLQNRGMLVTAQNVRAMVHILAQTRNVTADFSGVTGECDAMSTLETAGGFTATYTKQADTTFVPTVVKNGGAGSVTATGTLSYRRRNGYVFFDASVSVSAYTGPIDGLFFTLPVAVKTGKIIGGWCQNQNTTLSYDTVINSSGVATIGNPVGGAGQVIAFSGWYEEA
jgi:hypothetical protein